MKKIFMIIKLDDKRTLIINFNSIADKVAKELGIKTTIRNGQKALLGTKEQIEKFNRKMEEIIKEIYEKETKTPEYIS
jgi:hypothetical protein